MSDGELRDQLMTLLLAGHETTATGLAWAFDLLLHTPADARAPRRPASTPARPTTSTRSSTSRCACDPSSRSRAGCSTRAPISGATTTSRDDGPGRDLHGAHEPRPLPRPVRLPPRALPRRSARHLLLDPVRRRDAALHRRRLRPDGDAHRAAHDRRVGDARGRRPAAREDDAPQRHPVAARRRPGRGEPASSPSSDSRRSKTSGTCCR